MIKSVLDKLEYNKVLTYIAKYAVTDNGKTIILEQEPYDNENQAIDEGALVTEAKEILIKNVHPPLEYLSDVYEALSQSTIEGAFLDAKKILEILRLAVMSRNLFTFFKNNPIAIGLKEITEKLFYDKVLEHHIQKVISDTGDIKENASAKLAEIRADIRSKNDELVKSVNRIMKSLEVKDIIREDYVTLRDGRIVIPIKVEHKRHIRGFIHSESSTGQTVYIEPEETLELNNDIISLTFAERREIERILRELTKKIGSYSPQLKTNLSIISYIDSIFAKANYSIESIGSYPQVNNKKPFIILDGRHPILLKKGGKNNTVPLNLNTENQVVIITGPNAGGKTVVLKTIGLLCLMVQSGIHIPANPDSNFHFFKDIYVDIGDEQSIEDDLSTFSSHLSNINKIVLSADTNSLVLVDEIGTGTDPTEGAALAAAMLIKLKEKGAIVFASTHHGSLKIIANELEGFENSAMEFDNLNLKPTYIFKQGVPGSSYAFEIAKRIGFDNNFLSLAENYLDGDKHKLENFLVQIESKSKDLEDKLRKAELESARLSGLTNLYKKNVQKLEDDKRDILKKAKDDAAEYLKDMNRKFEQLVREIKESNANQEVIKQTRKEIHHLTEKNEELVKEKEPVISNEEFILGDAVAIKNTNTSGEIVELTKDGKTAVIKIGTIKMKVPVVNLEHTKKEKIKINYEPLSNYQPSNQQLRLDIRGAKPEEVEFDIIRFIDDAYTSNVERIEILHGKGTGVLKKTVHQILKKHEKVSSFYFAPVEFGGEGITIAELK